MCNFDLGELDIILAKQKGETVKEAGDGNLPLTFRDPGLQENQKLIESEGRYTEDYQVPEIMVSGSSFILAPVLIDDSVSMGQESKDGILKEDFLFDGIRLMAQAFKAAADDGKDILLLLYGFHGKYFEGHINDFDPEAAIRRYSSSYDYTPLVRDSISLAEKTMKISSHYQTRGINVHVGMLSITDGERVRDIEPVKFRLILEKNRHWRVQGMGIIGYDFSAEEINMTFESMGIREAMPTDPGELAARMFEYSQSASAIS